MPPAPRAALLPTLALAAALAATPAAAASGRPAAREGPAARARRALYLQRNWGVDVLGVRRVASGSMLRFDYRVVDPARAATLADRRARPYLIDEATRTALAVPAMENVGELRQTAPLAERRTYYIVFGNPGGLVKRGGRVTLVVGHLRVEGLPVN